VGYEILYCARCQAQLRGREFESGDAFRIEEQAVCKKCAPEVVKSLPPDKVQILLKQMVVAQGKTPPKTARSLATPPLSDVQRLGQTKAGPNAPSLTPLWAGLAVVLILVLGLGAWVIGGFGHPAPSPPKAGPPREAIAPPAPSIPSPRAKEPDQAQAAPAPAKDPKVVKPPEPPPGPWIPGLVGHWKLDDGAGTSAADSSGNASPGTLVGGPVWVPGKLGSALSFNGDNAVLNVQASASMKDLMKSGLTVCAWISPRGIKRGHVVDKSNANMGWLLAFKSDSRIQFSGDQYQTKELLRLSSKTLVSNVWYHVAATWDGDRSASHAHVYINGLLADGEGIDGSGAVREGSSPTLSIGNRRTQDRGFDGLIDDVRVYNRVLSAAEILGLVNGMPK